MQMLFNTGDPFSTDGCNMSPKVCNTVKCTVGFSDFNNGT